MKKLIVTIAALAAALYLAAFGLKDIAADRAQAEHLWLMQTLLPGSESFTRVPYDGDDTNILSVHEAENGFVIQTASHGYAGEIVMSIGVSKAGKVTGLVVEDMAETVGLGANALTDHVFLSQFLNSSGNFAVVASGEDAFSGATAAAEPEGDTVDVDAISGATVTSKTIVRCVNSAVAYVTGADAVSAATSWGG